MRELKSDKLFELDENSYWTPIYGKEYFLTHKYAPSICSVGDEIKAFYLGKKGGNFLFFKEEENSILFYSAPSNLPATYYGEVGCFYKAGFADVRLERKLEENAEKEYILGLILKWSKK